MAADADKVGMQGKDQMSGRVWSILIVAVVICGAVAVLMAPASNAGIEAGSALTFIALVAVGIERLLEMWWGLVGSRLGGWWPLNQVVEAMKTAEEQANQLLDPLVKQLLSALETEKARLVAAGDSTAAIDTKIRELTEKTAKLQAQYATAQKLAPGSERMALVTKIVADSKKAADDVLDKAGDAAATLKGAIDAAKQGTDLATTIVGAFSDNPARRMMSILLGASIGMVVAGFLGLNLFAAVLEGEPSIVTGIVGILLTGIVMGLGSSPTHEVIKVVQQYKEARKPNEMPAGGEEAVSVRRNAAGDRFDATSDSGEVPLRSSQ